MTEVIVITIASISLLIAGGILLGALVVLALPTIAAIGMDKSEIAPRESGEQRRFNEYDYDEDI